MNSLKKIVAYIALGAVMFNLGYLVAGSSESYNPAIAAPIPPADGVFSSLTYGTSNDVSHWKNNYFDSPKNSKIVSGGWVLESWKSWHTDWLKKFTLKENADKIPMMYIYTVAGKARASQGLQDCNVGAKVTLCQNGANFLRNNYKNITQEYTNTAQKIKTIYGDKKPILLQMEPDFYQYHNQYGQQNPLTNQEAWNIMNTWTDSIKSILPNARLVMDVSPWGNDLQTWSSGFRNFTYAGLVGRDYPASGEKKTADGVWGKTYSQISQLTGKQLILNTAHGPAGVFLPYDTTWENTELIKSRFKDGVIAVIQPPNANERYTNYISRYSKNPIK